MNGLLTPLIEYQPNHASIGAPEWRRLDAKRIDLHCHSAFSDEHISWLPGIRFHPMLEPEELYDLAKARGMDFVTITDHDTIDGCKSLIDRRGPLDDFVFGEEISVRFPEDGTVVHVNVFDIDEHEHAEIQRLRGNIHDLVDYLSKIGKLFVLNHMTWTQQHRPLDNLKIEAMLELFDVFEGLNGTRSHAHNAFTWHATHGKNKILVAGSDSHTNRVGTTYTLGMGETPAEFIAGIREGRATTAGAFGTPEQLRDDVWLTLQKNAERQYMEATSAWKRGAYHMIEKLGRIAAPFVCLGYHARQHLLIRKSLAAIPR